MKKLNLLQVVIAVIAVSILSGVVGGIVVAAWPFGDVSPSHWAYQNIKWLYDNKITTGYGDNTYRPNNTVQRDEMAAFLHRHAGVLVAAGVSVKRNESDHPYIDSWFNNVNGVAPTIVGNNGFYDIDLGFPVKDKFFMCTVNTYHSDTRDAVCTVNLFSGNRIYVRIYDISKAGLAAGEFWLLVYGNDIQP